jgi:hypothetical protein
MYIVANHTITNPEKFWKLAQALVIPPHIKLHCVFPSDDGARGTCLWQADSIDVVKQFLEPQTNGLARNDYMRVQAENAFGLPK